MLRAHFLWTLTGSLAMTGDPQSDPALNSSVQSLRVLLGHGDARDVDERSFTYDGRRYRGTYGVASNGEIVNTVALEDYLYSVVPREMPPAWPLEALRAQAIVARTYVLARSNPRRDYDVVPSQADQVYTGMDAETAASSAAVDAVRGQVLRFNDGFAKPLYSSCCGGRTENAFDVWHGAPIAYLEGVACPYCTASPWYRWTRALPVSQVQSGLSTENVGDIRDVSVAARDASGRARDLRIDGTMGSATVAGAQFRARVGPRSIPSLLLQRTTYRPDPVSGTLTLDGAGLGHGVGMCQWGARGFALTGGKAQDILSLYFPGTRVANE